MSQDDWNFALAGLGIMVAPFLVFTLWTFVPVPDRRVAEWFGAFGRLHRSGVPLVRARLRWVRWHRRIGALLGAVVAWGIACWYGIVERDGGPPWLWILPLGGYVTGAVLAELRALRTRTTPTRTAELAPRRVSDFVAPWVVRALVATSFAAVLVSLAVSYRGGSGVADALIPPAGALTALSVALWCAGRVAQAPLRLEPGRDPYLDDAFRQVAITTCLASAGIGTALTFGDAIGDVVPEAGWWQFTSIAVTWFIGLPCWVALRQPVPWTFGPRIRDAWVDEGTDRTRASSLGLPS